MPASYVPISSHQYLYDGMYNQIQVAKGVLECSAVGARVNSRLSSSGRKGFARAAILNTEGSHSIS